MIVPHHLTQHYPLVLLLGSSDKIESTKFVSLMNIPSFYRHKNLHIFNTRGLMAFILLMSIFSCRKEIVYEILIHNNTDYRLDRIHVSTRDEDLYPSVEPRGETRIFLDSKRRPGIFVRPSWDFGIQNYSDSLGSYEYRHGDYIALDQLDKKKVNQIVVFSEPNPEYADDIFEISINE